ncbi:MAG: site-specific integrase [Xanthomonadales bacterium]|nr:site-specific integrase [Xanthomonadales bacterium]
MRIYQRGKRGTWWVRFTAPDGRRIHQSTGTADQRQAQEYADRLKAQCWRTRRLGERPRRSWQEAVLRFVRETRHKRSHASDLAKLRWLDHYLGDLMLDQVNPDVLDRIRRDILAGKTPGGGCSPANLNRYLALVRSILRKAAGEWQWLDRSPPIRLARERHGRQHEFRWLSRDKAMALTDALDAAGLPHTADMARFTLATGLRESNVVGLSWDQVDLARRQAWVGESASKSGRALSVPLNDDAVAILRRWRFKHAERVFVWRGQPLSRANNKGWREVLVKLGLKPHKGKHPENFRWHDLRHTWASWHVMAGTPLEVLQRLGGWSSLDMVLRYAHLAPGHVAAYAANVTGPKMA